MVNKIRLFLVDDHELVRLGLKSLLSFYSHIEIVGESGNTEDALAAILSSKPDIVLLDIKMPGKNGIQACREMNEADPSIQVIMLTSFDDDESIYESIMAGAKGYILKEIGSRELVQAIETVAQGNSMLDPAVTARVLHKIKHPSSSESKWERLTSQEKEVLNLISKGMTNRQIARNILLGEKTVRNYVSVIFSKLEVSNRAEAAVYTVRHHLDKE